MSTRKSRRIRRIRCLNAECGTHIRTARSTRKTCSPACKMAVSRQRQRAADQLAAEAKAAADVKAETDALHERIINELADRKRKADAREREATEQKEAEPSEPAPSRKDFGGGYGGFSPAAEPITVHLGRVPTFGEIATPLPPNQRSPWR